MQNVQNGKVTQRITASRKSFDRLDILTKVYKSKSVGEFFDHLVEQAFSHAVNNGRVTEWQTWLVDKADDVTEGQKDELP